MDRILQNTPKGVFLVADTTDLKSTKFFRKYVDPCIYFSVYSSVPNAISLEPFLLKEDVSDLLEFLGTKLGKAKRVVFESISPFYLHFGMDCLKIIPLLRPYITFIGYQEYLGGDINEFQYICDYFVTFRENHALVHYKNRLTNKKLFKKLSHDSDLVFHEKTKEKLRKLELEKEVIRKEKEMASNLLNNLPFNLNLSKGEIEQKKSVVLPYTRAQNIVYTHELDDDFDEEDPDADLEI